MSRKGPYSAEVAHVLVWLASGIVSSSDRREWTAEWKAELCHVCRSRACDPIRFTVGAFQDAFWIRSDDVRSRMLALFPRGSAMRRFAELLFLAAVGLLLCICLPRARRAFSAAVSATPPNLVTISSDGYEGTQFPSIAISDYREWKADASRLFTEVAFCRPVVRRIDLDHHRPVNLAVAIASENLLRVLDVPDVPRGSPAFRGRELFLTESAWRLHFHADPRLRGTTAVIGGSPVVIAGILPDRGWHLPGQIQAFLIENSHQLDSLPSGADGFVFARLRNSAFPAGGDGWHFLFEERNDGVFQFECVPFAYIWRQPISIFLFALLAACIALPATTAMRLGDYPDHHGRARRGVSLRRWAFLLMKFVLVVLIAGSWSFALAYAGAAVGSSTSLYIQLGTAFPGLLCAFRWTLHDQRSRCPVCLRLLSNPARVGQPSCNFLAWCGTEWICQSGHGLLHIPELPTCWFSTQRWLCLDASWASLFPAGSAAP
jgi:hypothetical protein